MAKKFNAAAWVDAVDAIPGIDVYIGQHAGEGWLGITFGHHLGNRVTEPGMDHYGKLAADMDTTRAPSTRAPSMPFGRAHGADPVREFRGMTTRPSPPLRIEWLRLRLWWVRVRIRRW